MAIIIRSRIPFRVTALRLVIAFVFIYFVLYSQQLICLHFPSNHPRVRGVIVTLIRSNNRSVNLAINMIHSINQFYLPNENYSYPILIFHDHNFTSIMREQLLSCVLKTKKQLQISFALVDFRTSVSPISDEDLDRKPIGYRLMCRFWSRDVFFHPAIVQGNYDYLMRLDDDSYFSQPIDHDLFAYMACRKLDYIYRAFYYEITPSLLPGEKLSLKNKTNVQEQCLYNNFFAIRLKWFYTSKRLQTFLGELVRDDRMLLEYIGDGCVHATWQNIDSSARMKQITHISYGHNFHTMAEGTKSFGFMAVEQFHSEIEKSCQQLTVMVDPSGNLTRIKMS